MSDHFLNDFNCIDRLVEEHRAYKRLVVAIDFDNTIYDFHKKGHHYPLIISLIQKARKANFIIIVLTNEHSDEYVSRYLHDNGIDFDFLNKNHTLFTPKSKSIYYNILLDDRAGLSSAYFQLTKLLKIISA